MPEAQKLASGFRPLVLAAALGLLHAGTFAPWGHWWTQLLVLVGLAGLTLCLIRSGRSLGLIALGGLLFGFGWFIAGVGWLFVSMHTYGQMPAPLALLALVLFAIYLALFPAAAVWATASLTRSLTSPRTSPRTSSLSQPPIQPLTRHLIQALPFALPFALAFAATLTLGDLARGHLFTGFPWLAIGYAQVDGPLAGFAPIGGSYAVGFAACLVAALLAALLPRLRTGRSAASWAAGVAVAALLLAGGVAKSVVWSEPAGDALKVRLLQGNVPQQLKFDPRVARQTLQRYLELVEAEPADLIVLPETAWTVPWASTPPELADRLERFVKSSGSAVAIGMPLSTASNRAGDSPDSGPSTLAGPALPTNSVLLFDRAVFAGSAQPARYDKHHLVPFGEFVPWGFRWFVDLMTIPLGDFGRGSPEQPPFVVGRQRIALNICYEDVFGEELLPALTRTDGATILANISNIAWFGDSHALPQHLQIARMRTLETARPMIRATNTGVTAAIDFDGRVIGALPAYQLGALSVTVQGRSGLTPYARTGNWPVAVLSLLILLILLASRLLPSRLGARAAEEGHRVGARRQTR